MAIHTRLGVLHHGGAITLHIVGIGQLQNLPRAKRDTVPAALASLLNKVHDTLGNLNGFSIERGSPISHGLWSFIRIRGGTPIPFTPPDQESDGRGGWHLPTDHGEHYRNPESKSTHLGQNGRSFLRLVIFFMGGLGPSTGV